MITNAYRESVRPDPATKSGLLAMVDGVYTVVEHTELSDPRRTLWTAVLVAAVTLSEGERQVCAHR